ncbi:hypothetical protein HLK59_29105 [Streptomyces sp. S3(2020)]|uniref:hypothetical protein n=1 Tax=Streptomyces sp. S3(2020) TaxID=2732044 RepID=UPI0014894FF7|nr:hypothetical protein [Streptomyces sp. S3(2020)]NNN34351.1 hypothetical protein [Streptomyces sp. S3(2020)]
MKRTCAAALVAMMALGMVTTGCGPHKEDEKQSGTDRGTPAASAGLRELTDAEQLRIADAQQRLIKRCMARKGFEFWEAERLGLEESRTLGWVTDDVAWANEHGYGSRIEAKHERARLTNRNVAYRKDLSDGRRAAYDKALDEGIDAPVITAEVPTGGTVRKRVGGCVAEAEKQLYGDRVAWFRAEKTVMGLQPLYVPELLADKRFTAALASWSRCMARSGHTYRTPQMARQAAVEKGLKIGPGKAFEAERKLAVADATCAKNTSLRSIGNERESHYVNKLRGRYGSDLGTYARLQLRALARAAKVVEPRT